MTEQMYFPLDNNKIDPDYYSEPLVEVCDTLFDLPLGRAYTLETTDTPDCPFEDGFVYTFQQPTSGIYMWFKLLVLEHDC